MQALLLHSADMVQAQPLGWVMAVRSTAPR